MCSETGDGENQLSYHPAILPRPYSELEFGRTVRTLPRYLCHQPLHIEDSPVLLVFAVAQGDDVDDFHDHILVSRRHAEKLALVGSVKGFAGGYLIPFSNHIVDFHFQVGKGRFQQTVEEIDHCFGALGRPRRRCVVDEIRSENLVDGSFVAAFDEFFVDSGDEYFVLFG